jgi:hypothetical protein
MDTQPITTAAETQVLFDATRPLAIKLPPDGARVLHLHFPTDEQWVAFQHKNKVIQQNLGRNRSQTRTNREVAARLSALLIEAVRTDPDGPPIGSAEATYAMKVFSECDVTGVTRGADGFRVEMRVLGGLETAHVLRGPNAEEIEEYRFGLASVLDLPHGQQEITINLEAAARTYAKLKVSAEGYAGAPPVTHQNAAIRAAIEELEMFLQGGEEAGN